MADFLNHSSVNIVNVQHEFGIFGGESGEYICEFLDKLKDLLQRRFIPFFLALRIKQKMFLTELLSEAQI